MSREADTKAGALCRAEGRDTENVPLRSVRCAGYTEKSKAATATNLANLDENVFKSDLAFRLFYGTLPMYVALEKVLGPRMLVQKSLKLAKNCRISASVDSRHGVSERIGACRAGLEQNQNA